MIFSKFDILSSTLQFNIGNSGIRRRTQIGGFLSLIAILSSLIYFVYNIYLFFTNQIQPKFLSQTFVNGQQTDIQLQNNLVGFRFEYEMNKSIQILEKQNNSTYFVIYSQLDRGSQQLDIPLDIIECTDPELIGFNCLDFSQLQNQTLSLNDQKNIYSRIQIGYTSCYQVINEINCASQEETDQVVTNGVLHIKTLSQQYNTTSQKIQINYKNYFANLQPNSTFEKTYDIIKQQTTIIQGAFYQSEQQFSSPVSLEFSNSQTYNYLGLLIVLNFQPSQEIQYIKIQYSSIPEILSSCNGFLTMAMAIGIFARYISSNLLKQDLFLIILQNMYQSTYQLMVMKSNIQLNSKGEIQQIKSKISKIEQKTKKKKKDKECEQQENNNQFNNIEKIQKSQLCCFHIKKKTNNKKITKINQEFNQMQDIITKSEVVKLPSTQQKYNEKDIQNTQIIRKDAINTTIDLQNKDQEGNFLLFNKDKNVLTQFQILQGKSNQNLRVNEKKIEEDQGSLILNSNMTSSQLALNQHSFQFAHSEVCQQFDVKDIENSIQIPCFQTQYIDNSVKKPNRKQENQKNTQFQSTSFLIPNQTLLNPQNFNNQVTNFLMNPSSPELKTQDLTIKDDQNNNKVNQLIKSHKIVSSLSNQKNQNLQNQFLKNQHQDGNSDINSDQCYNNRIFNQYEHINNYHMSNLNQFPLKSIQDQDTQDVDKNDKKLDDQKTFEKKQSKQNSVDQLQLDNQQSKINEVAQTNNSENKISSKQNKDSQKNERGQKHIQQANLLKNSQTCQQDFEQLEQQQQIQNKAFVINANSDEKQIEKQRYLFSDPIKNYIKNIIFKLKLRKKNEYLISKGLDLETKKQIEEQIYDTLDIYKLQKDLILIKKAIMIILSCDQLAALNLIGVSKHGIENQKNHFMNQFSLLKSDEEQLKQMNNFLSRLKEQTNLSEIDQRILSSINFE